MLARDADSVYWMARYIERAEHIARVLWVNSNLLVDVGDLAPALQDRQWESVLTIFHAGNPEKTGGSTAICDAPIHDLRPGQSQQHHQLPHPRPRKCPRRPRD